MQLINFYLSSEGSEIPKSGYIFALALQDKLTNDEISPFGVAILELIKNALIIKYGERVSWVWFRYL